MPNNNGTPILSYDVFSSANSGPSSKVGSSATNSFQSTGLSIGNNYLFSVQAINAAGRSLISPYSLNMIAATPPDPPTNLIRVYADGTFITIGWNAPGFNGGSPVIAYKIYWDYASNGMGWAMIANSPLDSLVYTLNADVILGRTYQFKITAVNAVGDSSYSSSLSVISANFPSQPAIPTVAS